MLLDPTTIEGLGYAAAGAVLLTFCMSTMVPLRAAALMSNVLFVTYGAIAHLYPVLILHSVLLPVNAYKLFTIRRLANSLRQAESADVTIKKLVPLMAERRAHAGETLFRAGDPADRMYYVANGTLVISEIGKTVGPGTIPGEIGIFAAEQKPNAYLSDRLSVVRAHREESERALFPGPFVRLHDPAADHCAPAGEPQRARRGRDAAAGRGMTGHRRVLEQPLRLGAQGAERRGALAPGDVRLSAAGRR